jgi:Tol biopolymer transport system component
MKPGERLGAYEIVSALGAGGMGDVYKAHDPRLDRDVAVKILSSQLAGDPDAVARFEREALSVAKLSHPNILAIYEFGRAPAPGSGQEVAFVVTELVDGETLRARLAHGPLQPRRAMAYGQQIARGIAAAHARGIVHRDLKPENVMITRDDHVKILDFGLAKPIAGVGVAGSAEETRAVNVKTSAGTVLGTFGYMAPEQVRGLAVDHRSDIFALGAVLYEMLSGERAFKGETAADTITAILTKEPPELDIARLAISPALDRIVRRCLEKSPELRFQSANDLAFALENLSTTSTASGKTAAESFPLATRPRSVWLPWAIAGLAVAGATATVLMRPRPEPQDVWQQFAQLTDAAGEETSPTIAPDGTTVAYVMRQNGHWGIYAQRVGGRNATPIVADPARDLGGPAYSPDGASIAFHESDAEGGIFVAGATGESVRRVTDIGFDPAWSPDGKQIAFTTEEVRDPASRQTTSSLYIVDAAGGTPRKLVGDSDAIQPAWSPSGRRIVYWSNTKGQRDLYTIPSAGGARTALTNDPAIDWSPEWSPDGRYVYFSSDRGGEMNLWRIAVNESTGAPSGQPEPVTNGVQASAGLARLSAKGDRLVFRSRVNSINPVAIPFDPATGRAGVPKVLDGSNNIRIPSDVSPDGTEIAMFSIGERQEDIYLSRADGSAMHRLTDDAARDRAPVFTSDGASIVFYSTRDGDWAAWTMRTDGSGLRKLSSFPASVIYPIVSPVDDRIVACENEGDLGCYVARLNGDRTAERLPNMRQNGGTLLTTGWSPDGRRLAGTIGAESGQYIGVAVYDLATHAMTVVSNDTNPPAVRWLPDSRHVVYFANSGSQLVLVDTVTKARKLVDVALPGPSTDDMMSISRDGRTIYYGAKRSQSDIWLAEKR